MKRKAWYGAVVAGLAVLPTGGCDSATALATSFTATLNGGSVVPPVATMATGSATFTAQETSIKFVINVSNLSGPATAAHIHSGAIGGSGVSAMNLCGTSDTPACATGTTATLQGVSSILDLANFFSLNGVLSAMRDSTAYVDVHTAANTGGEIRGQIYPIQ